MDEKDILKQSLKEIESELNSLEIPSEELQDIFSEMFGKLEGKMVQIGVTSRNLHNDIENVKYDFTKRIEDLYRKAQENNPARSRVQYAKIGIQQDSNTNVVRNNITQIPEELKESSYEGRLAGVIVNVFGAYGQVLKGKYTADVSELRDANSLLGIYIPMRSASPEDMDIVVNGIEREYEEQIYQRIKMDKETVTNKISSQVQTMDMNLSAGLNVNQAMSDAERDFQQISARLSVEKAKRAIEESNKAIDAMKQQRAEFEEKLKESAQKDENSPDITMTLENGDVVELGAEVSVIISQDGKRTQVPTQEVKQQTLFVENEGGKIVINPDNSMEIIMENGNETVKMTLPREKLQDMIMGNIKASSENREEKGITEQDISNLVLNSGATAKTTDAESRVVKNGVRKERGELTAEEFKKLTPGEREEMRKESPKQYDKLFEECWGNVQDLFK